MRTSVRMAVAVGVLVLLGGLAATPEGYEEMTRFVKGLAAELCKGRIVSTLEGGYSLKQLPGCVEAHVRALLE